MRAWASEPRPSGNGAPGWGAVLLLPAVCAGLVLLRAQPCAADAGVLADLEGDWGIEQFDDMSCAANPMHIDLTDSGSALVLTWQSAVAYSDGGVRSAETFTVVSVEGRRVEVRRDRDGERSFFVLAPDGMSYHFNLAQADGAEGSTAVRCAKVSS